MAILACAYSCAGTTYSVLHYAGDRRSLQPFGLGIMPVMEVIEAQSARTWSLTITSITNMCG
jgi:hypothetical protein